MKSGSSRLLQRRHGYRSTRGDRDCRHGWCPGFSPQIIPGVCPQAKAWTPTVRAALALRRERSDRLHVAVVDVNDLAERRRVEDVLDLRPDVAELELAAFAFHGPLDHQQFA